MVNLGSENGHVTEVVSLREGEWLCYGDWLLIEGDWSCYSLMEGEWSCYRVAILIEGE